MKVLILMAGVAAAIAALLALFWLYTERIGNPRVAQDLLDHPDGARAGKVMLLTLPSGRRLPVNYLRKGDLVYAGADGGWWRELTGEDPSVTVWIRGESQVAPARVVVDDPEYTARIFAELRPKAIKGFGRLVEIRLASEPSSAGTTAR